MPTPKNSTATAPSRFRINWNNRGEPFGERIYKALDYLAFKAKQTDARAACDAIEKIAAEREKHRLFQKFFPAEWRVSRTSCFKSGFYENYSERVNEFFGLINKNLFPLLSGWNEDPETDFENFHVFSINFDLCCEDIEFEHLRASYLLGLVFYLESDELWEAVAARFGIEREDLPEISNNPHPNLWRAERTSEVASYLDLFEYIDHSTGNPWLDASNCCQYGDFYNWKEETIVELAKAYREADKLLERLLMLDGFIETHSRRAMLDLIALWNTGELPNEIKRAAGGRAR